MHETYLTAQEIYEIDNISEKNLADYLAQLPPAKRELVSHIFSKNRAMKLFKLLADRGEETNSRLLNALHENGISHE